MTKAFTELTVGVELAEHVGQTIEILQTTKDGEVQSWVGTLLGTTDIWRNDEITTTTVHLNFTSIPIHWENATTTSWQAFPRVDRLPSPF